MQKDHEIGICRIPLDDLVERPGKKWADAFTLKNPEDSQTCKNAKGFTSLLYLVIQYVEEGQPIPVEPLPMTGVDSDVLTGALNSAVPVGPPKASLFLRVIKPNDLPKMDFVTGKADPYVSVKINGEVIRRRHERLKPTSTPHGMKTSCTRWSRTAPRLWS